MTAKEINRRVLVNTFANERARGDLPVAERLSRCLYLLERVEKVDKQVEAKIRQGSSRYGR